ncbi:nucleoside 2-deoxyribosyltransferase [Virgibacillus doumboii]|uniref:nucleoside 2-deoxyribosyltransferase n=1 Tax=Virgibacillus doumboii TaxID=2697503 RepID=UPI0013E003D0|nr:nucleoside 2-deoxyribosyltransferase [Virgibacillus doumboii]
MKFYIASGFSNKELVRYVTQKLLSKGHSHTYDWTANERAATKEKLRTIGELEKEAVADCDLFILLLPGGRGSHTELGMALASGKNVYIYSSDEIDPQTATSFYYVDGVKRFYGDIDDFIKKIGMD